MSKIHVNRVASGKPFSILANMWSRRWRRAKAISKDWQAARDGGLASDLSFMIF